MSLLVHYTLKSADDHDHQVEAMKTLIAELKEEKVPVIYSAFTTDDPLKFVGILEYENEIEFRAFQASSAFESYRETVSATFANPPETTEITGIASTCEPKS